MKKALCLGISFQKQVVNPDATFHKEQTTIKNLVRPLSPMHTKEKKRGIVPFRYKDLSSIWLWVPTKKKFLNLQLSFLSIIWSTLTFTGSTRENTTNYIHHVVIIVNSNTYSYFM